MPKLAQQRKNRQRWLKELRSGNYKQTDHCLKSGDAYCCLGVLCDVYAKAKKIKNAWDNDSFVGCSSREVFNPPNDVLDWIGMTNRAGEYVTTKGKINDLTKLNDTKHLSFKQIAHIIEKEPEGLFEESRKKSNGDDK